MDNKKIGTLIAKLRKEKHMTQQELGDKVGVGSRAVSKWECGLTIPDISIINELSSILGITPKELLSGKLNETKNTPLKSKLTTKFKLLIISIIVLIISIISLLIYYNNKTYVYRMNAREYEKFKIDGYVTYKKGTISLYINKIIFNDKNPNLKIKDYQYDISIDDMLVFGYGNTKEDMKIKKEYTISDFENIFKINYTGKIYLSKKELIEKNIYISLNLIDNNNNNNFYKIEISLYKKEK